MLTTTSITAVSVSTRSAHATCRSPELIQGNSAIRDVMVQEADIDQRHPGQRRGDQQQAGGDQFGRARARGRRLGDVMVVVAVIVVAMVVMRVPPHGRRAPCASS